MPSKKATTKSAKTNGVTTRSARTDGVTTRSARTDGVTTRKATTRSAKTDGVTTRKADGSKSQASEISSRLPEPNLHQKPVFPETTNGYVAGENNRTGKTFVKADSGNTISTKVTTEGNRQVGQQALVKHDVANAGSRVVVTRTGVQVVSQEGVGNTSNKEDKNDLDTCSDFGGGGNPDEPEEPEEPQPPPPPQPPGPNEPEEPQPPPAPGQGCYPDDDCQWYNSPDGNSSNCPTGTTYKGFAELSGGNFKVLCCGENRPAGDGCPDDPDTYGWQCVNGTCEQLPAGIYATKAECEQDCNQDEPCLPWVCENDTCTFVGCGGNYLTLGECEASGCNDSSPTQPPFEGGQCPGASYQVSIAYDVYPDGETCDTPGQATTTRNATGPIRGVSLSSFNGIDGPCPQGEGDLITLNASNIDGSPNDILVQGSGSDIFANPVITDITPIGAAPNDCGDPPPT